ncbi:SwmB domain-containing protein [Verminephrobacter eiseniae]|uniref:SwmB domain-containing protein n=1 Tax=Verminephrobacter eiseniae TaxID=364317 RepID=UPI0022385BA4|nr:SwmB domain-containing protein [Verminephrobacter eiseniae]MCW5230634.1 hypothetical protein [Verminephrobacter eiseniae]MCW5292367.1 hypothetical protein [Verminephrobacter eiseniae]MCW8186883.1 hypothetical protein [Verminephrobacter eiseniae]MCW8225484.1 hypothetical protein [Verminephrobacter eiseniae]MCW8236285.1 hypothetical protein [Verminephrobacter eiseniae]
MDTDTYAGDSITVNARQLLIRYGKALKATDEVAPGAFTVLVDGQPNAVTGVRVNADGTVALTLATAVAPGQQVSVGYDPARSATVIQDAAGNAAAGFDQMPVANDTAAPTPAAPRASATPKSKPLDQDRDGLPDAREEQAPGITGPDGAVTGDGNGDGISDKTQSAVASTETVTLVAGSRDGKLGPDSLARITSLEHKAAPAQLPPEMEMPVGLLSFSAAPGAAGRSESFSLYVDPAQGANGYWIEDDTGIWVNLASAPYGGKMVTEGGRLRLDFQIEDGGRFDADGKADGVITVLGAAAYMPLSIIGKRSEDQALDFWF